MTNFLDKMISSILTALYQPFWFSVLAAVLFMFLYLYAKEDGWKNVFRTWSDSFKFSSSFRRLFLLAFYTMMILMRTLLNRSMWANPVSNVLGNWWIYDINGELTTEPIENIILMIPFTTLLLWALKSRIITKYRLMKRLTVGASVWTGIKYAFRLSVAIEFLQLFLRLGTFQLSDIFYNTFGGLLGGLFYYIVHRIRGRKSGTQNKNEMEQGKRIQGEKEQI